MSHLLGWDLDADKERTGCSLQLLGLSISVDSHNAQWKVDARKRELWAADIKRVPQFDCLESGFAAKLAGRFAFLNTRVFNRLGRALLRPIIWRQRQQYSSNRLTARLRLALRWFLALLEQGVSRETPLSKPLTFPTILLYTDAEGTGRLGAAAEMPCGKVVFLRESS